MSETAIMALNIIVGAVLIFFWCKDSPNKIKQIHAAAYFFITSHLGPFFFEFITLSKTLVRLAISLHNGIPRPKHITASLAPIYSIERSKGVSVMKAR